MTHRERKKTWDEPTGDTTPAVVSRCADVYELKISHAPIFAGCFAEGGQAIVFQGKEWRGSDVTS